MNNRLKTEIPNDASFSSRLYSCGMKLGLSLITILLSVNTSFSQIIHFESTTIDLDTICQMDKAIGYFSIQNTCDKPLVIFRVAGSSGSVVTSWDKNPIEPGDSFSISVQCYIRRHSGKLNKVI